jgi:putative oxidoreductase
MKEVIVTTSTTGPARQTVRVVRRRAAAALSRHSIDLLRVSLGLVFLVFGVLKFVPGLSPAEPLVARTMEVLTLGLLPESAALVVVAALETFIGVALLIGGRLLAAGLVALAVAMVGILSPLVLFAGDLLGGGPTLEAQYVFKDIVLVAAALVVTAKALGARLTVAR